MLSLSLSLSSSSSSSSSSWEVIFFPLGGLRDHHHHQWSYANYASMPDWEMGHEGELRVELSFIRPSVWRIPSGIEGQSGN